MPVVAVRTAEQYEHYKTDLSNHDVKFAFDDLEFEGPLVDVFGAIDAINDPVSYTGATAATSAAAIAWLADPSWKRDSTVHSVQRRDANAHDALAIKQLNGRITGLHAFDRRLAAQNYFLLGPRRSIVALISMFLIAQTAILLGIPGSFNEIMVSTIVGSGYTVGENAVSRRKSV